MAATARPVAPAMGRARSATARGRAAGKAAAPRPPPPAPRPPLTDKKELKDAIAAACELLRETGVGKEEDWEKRSASLRALPALLAQAAAVGFFEAMLESEYHGRRLAKHLSYQLADLRSQIVRVVCGVLGEVGREHGRAVAPLVVGVMPQLLKNLYVSVKAISASSHETALELASIAPTDKLLSCLLANAADSHHQTRRGAAECLAVVMRSRDAPLSAAQVNNLLKSLLVSTADADPTVRGAAAKLFWLVHGAAPAKAEEMMGKASASTQKMLKRAKP